MGDRTRGTALSRRPRFSIPLVDSIRELDPPPRRFLLFTAFNVVSWQCLMGHAMVLFARHLEMPASWVGWLLSFMPLSMLLVAVTVPLVTHFGSKRLMFMAWLCRNLAMSSVFLMPLVYARWGAPGAWYLLLGATLAFCVFRALGAGGWFPWIREVVPPGQLASFFSAETMAAQSVSVVVGLALALLLRGHPGMWTYLAIYAVGMTSGLSSLLWMLRVPGGQSEPNATGLRQSFAQYKVAAADRPFLVFVLVMTCCFMCITWLQASLVMFMRDLLLLRQGTIMAVMTVGSLAVLATARSWGKFAEHSGNGRALFKTATGHAAAAMACLLLVPGARWTPFVLVPAVALATVWNAAFWLIGHRAMLGYVKDEGRVAYTNVWTLGIAVSLGLTPIAVGRVIEEFGMLGYQTCFMIAGLGGCVFALLCLRAVRDGEEGTRPQSLMMYPVLPIRTLGRIVWITAGLHESTRNGKS